MDPYLVRVFTLPLVACLAALVQWIPAFLDTVVRAPVTASTFAAVELGVIDDGVDVPRAAHQPRSPIHQRAWRTALLNQEVFTHSPSEVGVLELISLDYCKKILCCKK
jgi:1-aminocyclopropane-1-carboxylate deaminase/D-cysteine desulfhydrase-like pyridoxal-dependent ACC family enzyme